MKTAILGIIVNYQIYKFLSKQLVQLVNNLANF